MIRAEVRDLIRRHRVMVIPLALAALGLVGVLRGGGPVFLAGSWTLVGTAVLIFFAFRQQLAFHRQGAGAGVVEIDEARITYLAPVGGQVVDRDALISVELEIWAGAATWILTHRDGPPLEVPLAARGAEAVVDLVDSLPGARLGAAEAALKAERTGTYPVWAAPG